MAQFDLYLIGVSQPFLVDASVATLGELKTKLGSSRHYEFKLVCDDDSGAEPGFLVATSCIRMIIERLF